MRAFLVLVVGCTCMFGIGDACAQSQKVKFSENARSMEVAIQAIDSYFGDMRFDPSMEKLEIAWIDLNNDGKPELITHRFGSGWIGSLGQPFAVFEEQGSGWENILYATGFDMRISSKSTKGWKNIVFDDTLMKWTGKDYEFRNRR